MFPGGTPPLFEATVANVGLIRNLVDFGHKQHLDMSNPVRQSICAVCGKTVRPGGGTVLEFGAGGRVHTVGCLAITQKPAPRRSDTVGDIQPSSGGLRPHGAL